MEITRMDDEKYVCRLGVFYKVFTQNNDSWEFRSNGTMMSENDIRDVLLAMRSLKMGLKNDFFEELAKLSETPEMKKVENEWCERMSNPLNIEGCKLVCKCAACPEAYDVFNSDGKKIGYLRLRHGFFRADYPDYGKETVYTSKTKGDGIFHDEERNVELKKAVSCLLERHAKEICTGHVTD